MIRGYFATIRTRRRPVVDAVLRFPTLGDRSVQVRLLVDTGADRENRGQTDILSLLTMILRCKGQENRRLTPILPNKAESSAGSLCLLVRGGKMSV